MTKKIIFGAMLCIAAISAFVACDKKDKEEVDEITLFGTVVDDETGLPVQNAQIELYKAYASHEAEVADHNGSGILASTVTGSDGSYEFSFNRSDPEQSYWVIADKPGYAASENRISTANVKSGGKVRCDFQLHTGEQYKK